MGTNDDTRSLQVLLVEDSPADVLMTREALMQSQLPIHLHVVEDGVDALAFLRQEGRYAEAPRPDLVLLDLNLPKMDGREVLDEIKGDAVLRLIPLVVLTTSAAQDDVRRAYGSYANCYITKPLDFMQFQDVIRSIKQFWFSVATLPRA